MTNEPPLCRPDAVTSAYFVGVTLVVAVLVIAICATCA